MYSFFLSPQNIMIYSAKYIEISSQSPDTTGYSVFFFGGGGKWNRDVEMGATSSLICQSTLSGKEDRIRASDAQGEFILFSDPRKSSQHGNHNSTFYFP